MNDEQKTKAESALLVPQTELNSADLMAIGAIMQPIAMTLADASKAQAEASVKQAEINAEMTIRQAELTASGTRIWHIGVLIIIGALAAAAIVTLFTGREAIGEKLIFGVIGFFGGYGASLVSRK